MNTSNEQKVAASSRNRMVKGIWHPSKYVQGSSLIAGYAAGEAYSIYAVFGAHALTPVTAYLVGQTPYLRAVSGKYREVLDLGGLLSVLLISLTVFTLTWCIVRTIAWTLAGSVSEEPGDPSIVCRRSIYWSN
ncbi:MAG: hypothetical protein ACLQAT_27050 [Candidatus Binataceae bacterium]